MFLKARGFVNRQRTRSRSRSRTRTRCPCFTVYVNVYGLAVNRWVAGGCAFSACFARSAVGSAGVPARTEKGRARFRCAVWRPMNTRPAFFTKRCCGRGRPRSRLACFPFHPEHRTFANPGRQPIILSADGAVRAPSPAHLFHQKRIPFVPRSPPFTFTFPFTYTTPPFSRVRERVPLRCERVRLSRTCRDRRPATPNS
jgi:hypothetical protein